jgi:hypothetical protein
MSDEITSELAGLIKKGRELVDDLSSLDDDGWIDLGDVDHYQEWLAAAGHLLLATEGPESKHFLGYRKIVNSQRNPVGVQTSVFRGVFDLMLTVFEDWSCGALRKFEDIVAATILDSLLDQADGYRTADRTLESSVLARAVFEHAVVRIGAKHGLKAESEGLGNLARTLVDSPILSDEGTARLEELLTIRKRVSTADPHGMAGAELEGLIDSTRKLVEEFV